MRRSRLLVQLDARLQRPGVTGTFSRDLLLGVVWAIVSVGVLVPVLGPIAAELGVDLGPGEVRALLVVVTLQSLLLCLRRIRPVTCLLLVAASQLALTALLPEQTTLRLAAPMVAAYTCGTCLPPARLFRWLGVAALLEVVGGMAVSMWVTGPARTVLFGASAPVAAVVGVPLQTLLFGAVMVLMIVVLYLAAALGGMAVAGRRAYAVLLQERAVDAERALEARAQAAVSGERSRMARELHDVAAHHLSGLVVQAGAAERLLDRDVDAARLAVRDVRFLAKEALTNLRLLVGVLRDRQDERNDGAPPDGGDGGRGAVAAPVPSLAVLDQLVASARRLGDDLDVTIRGDAGPLAPIADVTAFRVLQEALANARRHAPGAPVRVLLERTGRRLLLTVENAAARHPVTSEERPGFGLLGMHERAHLAGGKLTAGPSTSGGWRVQLSVPEPLSDAGASDRFAASESPA